MNPIAKDLVTSLYLRLLGQLLHLYPWAQASFLLVTLVQPDPCQGPNPLGKDTYSWMTSVSPTRQDVLIPPQPRDLLCPSRQRPGEERDEQSWALGWVYDNSLESKGPGQKTTGLRDRCLGTTN